MIYLSSDLENTVSETNSSIKLIGPKKYYTAINGAKWSH
ncbi:hypothetical protein C8R34_1429 [Nitrosomonas sp. Nm84]|nr:hypothetical protein C8R34_1429 [Nitrosomonas sp. Nm84]